MTISQLEITTSLIRLDLPNLSANDKATLVALSTYTNPQRDNALKAWPTNACLASRTNLSERSIQKSLASLERLGYLERQTTFWQDTTQRSRLLVLNLNKLFPPVSTPTPVTPVTGDDEQEEWNWTLEEDDSHAVDW